jgi:plasmid stabilization system protein ParE
VNRVIHEEANREFREALDYYAQIDPELGARFYREMERLMHEVCAHPLLFRQFDPPARRHFTDRFPYGVVYLVLPDNIWIVAVMHLHREPGKWRARVG